METNMATTKEQKIKINDLVKVDGNLVGRITNIIQALNTYNVFIVKTDIGEMQVPRFRIKLLPDTVTSARPHLPEHYLPQSIIDELMTDDFLDHPDSEDVARPDRFVQVNDSDIDNFLNENENENTIKKTNQDLKTVRQYLTAKLNENRPLSSIPPTELCTILCKFVIGVRKIDGSEYEPNTIAGIRCSVDRHLRQNNYGFTIKDSH